MMYPVPEETLLTHYLHPVSIQNSMLDMTSLAPVCLTMTTMDPSLPLQPSSLAQTTNDARNSADRAPCALL